MKAFKICQVVPFSLRIQGFRRPYLSVVTVGVEGRRFGRAQEVRPAVTGANSTTNKAFGYSTSISDIRSRIQAFCFMVSGPGFTCLS